MRQTWAISFCMSNSDQVPMQELLCLDAQDAAMQLAALIEHRSSALANKINLIRFYEAIGLIIARSRLSMKSSSISDCNALFLGYESEGTDVQLNRNSCYLAFSSEGGWPG